MEARAGESGHVTLRPADLGQALELELLCRLRLELFRELGKAGAGEEAQFLRACAESVRRFHAAGVLHAWLAWTEDGRAGEAEAVSGLMLLVFPRLPTPGNLADSDSKVAATSVADRGPRLSPVMSTATATPVPGTTCTSP